MMKKTHKIIFIISIIVVVTFLSYICQQAWILLLYSSILSLFPNEIKNFFSNNILNPKKQIRLSYSYIFRIEVNGYYLLVKDEQGRNNYHPVGGVYKYFPEHIDITDKFEGTYDGIYNDCEDTANDLRIKIRKSKLKDFNKWFFTGNQRENINNLSREFIEELLNRDILPKNRFSTIKYKYLGSYTKKSYNESIKLDQIRHYDIIDIKLTNSQKECIRKLNQKQPLSEKYLFATINNINSGKIESRGKIYYIADYTKLIVVGNTTHLSNEGNTTEEYVINT